MVYDRKDEKQQGVKPFKIIFLSEETGLYKNLIQYFNTYCSGYLLSQIEFPAKAIEVAIASEPDVIVFDWNLHAFTALQFIHSIRRHQLTANVILIGVTDIILSNHEYTEAMQAGMNDIIYFPSLERTDLTNVHHFLELTKRFSTVKKGESALEYDAIHRDMALMQLSDVHNKLVRGLRKIIPMAEESIAEALKGLLDDPSMLGAKDPWDNFAIRFEFAHPGFFVRLAEQYPKMTSTEKRIAAFLRMNMTTKEIAVSSGLSSESIRKARIRLRKRIGLNNEDSLHRFLLTI